MINYQTVLFFFMSERERNKERRRKSKKKENTKSCNNVEGGPDIAMQVNGCEKKSEKKGGFDVGLGGENISDMAEEEEEEEEDTKKRRR